MLKVLVVDDATTVRMYHRSLLEAANYQVEEAANGYEALEKVMQTSFSLLLVDINMPKMDGYRLAEELRRNPDTNSIPIIMISTESEVHDRERAYQAGANYYLTKPVCPKQLTTTVSMLAGITNR